MSSLSLPFDDGDNAEAGEAGPRRRNERDEAARGNQCLRAKLRIRISARQAAAGVMEIEAALALRRIVQRFANRAEIGEAARLLIQRGRGARRREIGRHRGVAFEHAIPSFANSIVVRPTHSAAFLLASDCGTKTA